MGQFLQGVPVAACHAGGIVLKWTWLGIAGGFLVTIFVAVFICSCQGTDVAEGHSDLVLASAKNEISESELQTNVETLVAFGTRNTYSPQNSKTRGIGAAQNWLEERFRSFSPGGDRYKVFLDCLTHSGRRVCNVGALLKGKVSPDKFFIISGHYDSMPSSSNDGSTDAPGADDDASGTAVVLEAARVLSRYDVAVSVIFLATVGEEQGLLGAKHFAASLRKKGANVVGMITNDIVGSSDGTDGSAPDRLRVYSDWNGQYGTNSKALAERVKFAVESGTQNQFTLELRPSVDRPGRSGDHVAFLKQGYPAIRFIEPFEDLNHQHQDVGLRNGVFYGDLARFLEYDFMARVTLANVIAILSAE